MIPGAIPVLRVRTDDGREFRFDRPFHVGRSADCDIQIDDARVSRVHLFVSFDQDQWSFRDLQSANGVFVGTEPVGIGTVDRRLGLRLGGPDGPLLMLDVEGDRDAMGSRATRHPQADDAGDVGDAEERSGQAPVEPGGETMTLDRYAERYFGSPGTGEPVGERTLMIRRAFEKVHRRQQRKYLWAVGILALAGAIAGAYAYRGHVQLREQEGLAEDLFYAMKAIDVQIATVEQTLASMSASQPGQDVRAFQDQLRDDRQRRRDQEIKYDDFLSRIKLHGRSLSEQERLILRVTRKFGECELIAPPDYLAEVTGYIRRWQSTGRFARDVRVAQERGYTRKIVDELTAMHLPQEFFYLAMQESDFNPSAVGSPTRWGFAKGMWQFIPRTAAQYGLSVGPFSGAGVFDPKDDRFRWENATRAAARYIKDIYSTDAQASGLLVIASYNWGETRVIDLVKQLPPNPRERNFWKLIERFGKKMPSQTYDYVFNIVSAAVIGENPRLFGLPFDNPLSLPRG